MIIRPDAPLLLYKYLAPCRATEFFDFRVGHRDPDGHIAPTPFVRSLDTETLTATCILPIDPDVEIDLLRPLDTYDPLSCDDCLILGMKYRVGQVSCTLRCPHLFAEYYDPVGRDWAPIQVTDTEDQIAIRLLLDCERRTLQGEKLPVRPNRAWFQKEMDNPGCIRETYLQAQKTGLWGSDLPRALELSMDLPAISLSDPLPSYP